MDSTYVKEMERLSNEGRIIEKGDNTYSSLNMKPVFYEPRPDALTVRTLTGLRDYLAANRDKLDPAALIVQVVDHKTVSIISALSGKDRKRDNLIAAKFDGAVFGFGSWMDSEAFIIAVNSLFLPSSGRDEVLTYVSRLKIEDEANLSDDGVSQSATIRTGIKGGLVETAKAPSRTVLIPYRTFAEIDQPESEFVFRMKRDGNGGVMLALFEADGGAWKSIAQERIAGWIVAAIGKDIAIIA
jgi:hypothetical protein